MLTRNQKFSKNLNDAAQIIRKYNLGALNYFLNKFSNIEKEKLEKAWEFGLRKIQNREIIKDASHIHYDESNLATKKSLDFANDSKTLFIYLNSPFDVKKLKLSDENIERRLRKELAEKYIDLISEEVAVLNNIIISSRSKSSSIILKFKVALIILGIVGAISTPRIIKGLTPVETLTTKLHERSKYKVRVGAECEDGWKSSATGRGACSHHGGVSKWIYKDSYRKSIEACRLEAKQISWRD